MMNFIDETKEMASNGAMWGADVALHCLRSFTGTFLHGPLSLHRWEHLSGSQGDVETSVRSVGLSSQKPPAGFGLLGTPS